MANVLIIDDDVQLCKAVSMVVERMGHATDCAYTIAQGLEMAADADYDVVILDIRLPDGNGLDALPSFRDGRGTPQVIILSGSGDPDGAELAIRSGAWNYITKPPTLNKIQLPVQRAIEYHQRKGRTTPPVVLKRCGIVGESMALLASLEQVAHAACTEANVLITGKTGTGKELFARAIHENSRRAGAPFVVVDCAALPENLVESVLFGHEKGAFTGADKAAKGLVLQAHQGTLFLDEVGELPLYMQKAFLRVLQDRRFRPVGSVREVESDFRLVAATNRDLDTAVQRWTFRQDLLFRLRTVALDLPTLGERKGDIPGLAAHFSTSICAELGVKPKTITQDFLDALNAYDWPGNVRELASAVESAIAAAGNDLLLTARWLPMSIRVSLARQPMEEYPNTHEDTHKDALIDGPANCPNLDPDTLPPLKEFRKTAIKQLEHAYLDALMIRADGDFRRACEVSGMSRARLYALLKEHAIHL